MIKIGKMLLGLSCGAALIVPGYGTPIINGSQLNISGDATVGAAFLNWSCDQPGDTACPATGKGDFAVGASTGTFAQYNSTFGLETDINDATQPLNTPLALMDFITFDLNNNETIELTFIPLGTDTASTTCAGLTHCTPENAALVTAANPLGLSAFNLDQNGSGTSASFGIDGTLFDIGGGTASISGIYTAQFAGLDPQQVLALLGPSGVESTYSANLVLTVTPEPATIALLGAGLAALGLFRWRQKQ
ncbi:MAG: PEP-CTERM sorting domain-containing protein [Bryobacteraceae bacterium]